MSLLIRNASSSKYMSKCFSLTTVSSLNIIQSQKTFKSKTGGKFNVTKGNFGNNKGKFGNNKGKFENKKGKFENKKGKFENTKKSTEKFELKSFKPSKSKYDFTKSSNHPRVKRSVPVKKDDKLSPTIKGSPVSSTKAKKTDELDKGMKSKIYFNYGLNYGRLVEKTGDVVPEVSVVDKISTFEELKLLPESRALIKDIIYRDSIMSNDDVADIKPSPIQVQSVFTINKHIDKLETTGKTRRGKMKIYTIAAETGSGKTMAYLAPVIDYLNRYPSMTTKNAIRTIIFLPSQELIQQVYKTLNSSPESNFNVVKWDNSTSYNDFVEQLKSTVDILITTPSKIDETLFSINKLGHPQSLLNHCEFAVIDEADTLMSKTFLPSVKGALRKLPNLSHLILCSATIPKAFHNILNTLFLEKSNIIITTPKLHRLSHNLKFYNVDATLNPLKGNKTKALEQILAAINNDNTEPNIAEKRCIVFVNKKSTVTEILDKLQNKYRKLVGFSGTDSVEERMTKLKPFIEPAMKAEDEERIDQLMNESVEPVEEEILLQEDVAEEHEFKTISGSNIALPKDYRPSTGETQTKSEKLNVLVTTDLLARGLNFNGVRNVILYDVPQTSIDLIHRCGRTARYKQGGRVFMITDKTTKAWAKAIPTIIKKRKNIT